MTVLDNRVVTHGSDSEPADPRDPFVRLTALLDEGSLRLITPQEWTARAGATARSRWPGSRRTAGRP
ncbi:hypothetical protein AB0K48_57420, partial [Nonomuraea sp. NPDC055795]